MRSGTAEFKGPSVYSNVQPRLRTMAVAHPFHLGETEAPKRGGDLPLGRRVSRSFWGRVFSWCSCTWCGFLRMNLCARPHRSPKWAGSWAQGWKVAGEGSFMTPSECPAVSSNSAALKSSPGTYTRQSSRPHSQLESRWEIRAVWRVGRAGSMLEAGSG